MIKNIILDFLFKYEIEIPLAVLIVCALISFIALVLMTERNKKSRRYSSYLTYTSGIFLLVIGLLIGGTVGFYYIPLVKTDGAFRPKTFWMVWETVVKDSLKPPSQEKMFADVLKAIPASVRDKYTRYLDTEEAVASEQFDPGKEIWGYGFECPGCYAVTPQGIEILAFFVDSPVYKAGLTPGDVIVSIDGCTIESGLMDKMEEPGVHTFKITKFYSGVEIEALLLSREKFKIKGVGHRKEGDFAYLWVSSFEGDVVEDFEKAALEILKQKPKGLILDLRGNSGGDIPKMLKIANAWMPGKIVQIRKYSNGKVINDYSIKSKAGGKFKNLATVVLMDRSTASASEGLIAGLKYHTAARFVGEKTYGKTVAQEVIDFPDGSRLNLTGWEWTNPGGVKYDKGISPDIETAFVDALKKALEILSQ